MSDAGIERTLPYGSAAAIMILGLIDFNFLAIPAMVPPVPAPTITASSFPSHW